MRNMSGKDLFFGAVTAATPTPVVAVATAPSTQMMPSVKTELAPAVGVGALGYFMWHKHPVLGALLGADVGFNAYNIYKGHDRTRALVNIGVGVAGVTGSLMWKRHPVWGFIGGTVAGNVARRFLGK